MKNIARLTAVLPCLILLLVGCGEGPDNAVSPVVPLNGDVVGLTESTGQDDAATHQTLEAMWKNTDGVLMQVFTQTIDCQVGGVFTARPVGWPEGYDVSLTVDPGTLPLNHDPVVDFVMEIPVTGPTATTLSVPYKFHPDGIQFNQPVHVTVAWPQWAGAAPASGMQLWYLTREIHDGTQHYRVINRRPEDAVAAGAVAKALPVTLGSFSIDHFSRWNLSSDGTTTGGIPAPFGHVLATAREGDSCWQNYASLPQTEVRMDFRPDGSVTP